MDNKVIEKIKDRIEEIKKIHSTPYTMPLIEQGKIAGLEFALTLLEQKPVCKTCGGSGDISIT